MKKHIESEKKGVGRLNCQRLFIKSILGKTFYKMALCTKIQFNFGENNENKSYNCDN